MKLKKIPTMPGFELLFSAGIAAIFILPSTVLAQDTRNLEISIMNGDTVINGKNIKDLKGREREAALRDINKIQMPHRRMHMQTQGEPGLEPLDSVEHSFVMGENQDRPVRMRFRLKRDTIMADNFRPEDQNMERPHWDGDNITMRNPHVMSIRNFRRRNVQNFTFENTDNNGITTTVHYSVSEGRPFLNRHENNEHTATSEKNDLAISNIRLVADFSTGRTTLLFDLPAKTVADAELTNSEGKVIFYERVANGSLNKSFVLPLNGIYHLKVKQGGKTAVREISKEN